MTDDFDHACNPIKTADFLLSDGKRVQHRDLGCLRSFRYGELTAKLAGIHGTVKVSVTVDERGRVTDAEAIEGPKELREAAVEAARRARFEPPRVHGAPIKIDGVLTYEF